MPDKILSIVIPAYNEERFIGTLLERIQAVDLASQGLSGEIIVVDDCSADRTAEIVAGFLGVVLVSHEQNGGKGRAVRTGLSRATGDYIIIQDADLEYDPADYLPMLASLLAGDADAIYGSRYLPYPGRGVLANLLHGKYPDQGFLAYLGGRSLSFVCLFFTGCYLTDTVTVLKLFRAEDIKTLALRTTGFELDHEITAKLLARGYSIGEVPIRYFPRSRAEGKKIGPCDWFIAVRTFARYRRG